MCIRDSLYAVGDEDQSIYRWRGADYRNIQRFQADFKDARTLLLEENYRSTQTILDGAMAVSYTHLRAHETVLDLVCRLLLEKKKKKSQKKKEAKKTEQKRNKIHTVENV